MNVKQSYILHAYGFSCAFFKQSFESCMLVALSWICDLAIGVCLNFELVCSSVLKKTRIFFNKIENQDYFYDEA